MVPDTLSTRLESPVADDTAYLDETLRLDLLAQAMDALPLGVSISEGGGGVCLYQNHAAATLARRPARDGIGVACHRLARSGRTFDLTTFVDLSEQRAKEERLIRMAFFDDLTRLPKSALMQETVDGMIADAVPAFALSFIDIDNFKFVNDYYGHGIGDQLLCKVTERIAENCLASDLLARVGGDEFVLLTVPSAAGEEAAAGIERLSARLRAPFFIEGIEIFTSASIGVSLYPPHGGSYEALRANADRAMYRAKEQSKGGVKLFDASLSEAATSRMQSEQRLRLAIRDRSFVCAFQPKMDFWAGTIVGVEVLLRWRDGNGFLHAPGDLIKLALELGLMDEITMIVVGQVLAQIDQIDDTFGRDATISINIAAKQADDSAFMRKLVETLRGADQTSRFILELTEEAFLAKGEFQRNVLPLLRANGIGVSIDDFGVGYSSLSALAEIAADEVKVDRSFISQIHLKLRSQTILKVVEMLGRELGMRIVVEGVETKEELDYLRAHTQIRYGQGYMFARPMLLRSQAMLVRSERHGRAGSVARAGAQRR